LKNKQALVDNAKKMFGLTTENGGNYGKEEYGSLAKADCIPTPDKFLSGIVNTREISQLLFSIEDFKCEGHSLRPRVINRVRVISHIKQTIER